MLRTDDAYRPAAHVSNVRFEHLREPLGIGTPHPRLSWIVTSEAPGWRQVAYELEAYELEAYELKAYELKAYELEAYELEAYELKAYEPAGEGLLTAGLSTTARRGATCPVLCWLRPGVHSFTVIAVEGCSSDCERSLWFSQKRPWDQARRRTRCWRGPTSIAVGSQT